MKKRFLFIMATVLVLSISTATMISGCGCDDTNNTTSTPDGVTETQVQTVTEVATDEQGNTYIEEATKVVELKTDKKSDEKSESSEKSEKSEDNNKKDNSSNNSESSSTDKTNNSSNNNSSNKNNSGSNDKNTSSNNSSNSTSKNEVPKHNHSWVNMTKQVKVIDQEAYTYEEPVYERQGRTICNTCGADCTENRTAHGKAHMLNGEKSSYHDEWVNIQVGTKTVEVPEKSHYETEIIGRKCNSCGENEYY